ncbi:MAG: PocR ligand-binding domain-containing protein [Clostridia bacterium]|nr:PocR ligand-binding domain-containing protein [Clostridia bacterium]
MEAILAKDDGISLDRVKKSLDAYSRSVGVESILIDSTGKTLYNSCGNNNTCNFCSRVQGILGQHQTCQNVHLYGSYQAERFGGSYIFFCPIGLVHWASPITMHGTMKGAILGGPVLMVEPEEFLLEDMLKKSSICEEGIEELKAYIKDIPIIQPDIVNSLAELLFIVSTHISDTRPSQYLEDREYLEHQSGISEYLHYIKTMGGDEGETLGYPIEKEKELLSLISIGDKPGSQKVLNEIFGHIFFSTGGNFEIIKARVLELVVLLSRAAVEGGADVEQIFGLNYKYLSQVHDFKTVEELTYWLSKIMGRFTDCVFNLAEVKHIDVIFKAVDYIKRNYARKITLEEVASNVYLSPSYFSKVFKEEMKCNFNTYLNQIRIDMAKKLLLNETVALVDVSNLVGYEDQSYFTKVFKKVTGVSPGKYREARGKIRSQG